MTTLFNSLTEPQAESISGGQTLINEIQVDLQQGVSRQSVADIVARIQSFIENLVLTIQDQFFNGPFS